ALTPVLYTLSLHDALPIFLRTPRQGSLLQRASVISSGCFGRRNHLAYARRPARARDPGGHAERYNFARQGQRRAGSSRTRPRRSVRRSASADAGKINQAAERVAATVGFRLAGGQQA